MSLPAVVRSAVLARGLCCCWCGYTSEDPADFHVDHLTPRAEGGSDDEANLDVACAPCNEARGAKPPERQREWVGRSIHIRQTTDERFMDSLAQMQVARQALRGGA